MLAKYNKYILRKIKHGLFFIYRFTIGDSLRKILLCRMEIKHNRMLLKIKNKSKIRVIFLAIHKSVWKVDILFQKMLIDPLFEPIVFVCPFIAQGEERMWIDLQECFDYFIEKKYPVYLAYNKKKNVWVDVKELNPDIIFFTNPNDITLPQYRRKLVANYLTCYVPYFSDVATSYDLQSAYNQLFHNLIWLNFADSPYSKNRAASVMTNKARNLHVTGSPFHESFLCEIHESSACWKKQSSPKKKIIYAPHQSIFKDSVINLSTFIEFGEIFKDLSEKYKDKIQWSFKPHPLLKHNLYKHSAWGKEKTDAYFDYWRTSSYTQLDEGDYIGLFKTSDAILHDCGSFILDYLFTENPCGYLFVDQETQLRAINEYGFDALKCYEKISSSAQLEEFICKVSNGTAVRNEHYMLFIEKNIQKIYVEPPPSNLIIEKLKEYIA